MKICMISSTYPRYKGDVIPSFVHELARKIAEWGIEVHAVSPHHEAAKCEENLEGVFVHRFRYMIPSRLETLTTGGGMPTKIQKSLVAKVEMLPYLLSSFLKSLRICSKYRIDVVHAHWFFPSGLVGVLLKKLLHKPLVVTGMGVEFFLTRQKYKWLAFLWRWIAKNADECVFNSNASKDAAEGIGIRKSIVIPYGVDVNRFAPRKARSQLVEGTRRKYGVENKVIILAVGRLVERKGFKYLVQAMPHILKRISAVLVIVGAGPEKASLTKLVGELGLDDHVRVVGSVAPSDLSLLYNACDVFVLPAVTDAGGDQEGFGLVLCEAMSCGKPVIGTRVGGIVDVISEGQDGVLVEEKSVEQLSEAVVRVAGDHKLAMSLGENARVSAVKKFSCERAAREYVALYAFLLRKQK